MYQKVAEISGFEMHENSRGEEFSAQKIEESKKKFSCFKIRKDFNNYQKQKFLKCSNTESSIKKPF
jgi:hypothetical protein